MDAAALNALMSWVKENPSAVPEHIKAQLTPSPVAQSEGGSLSPSCDSESDSSSDLAQASKEARQRSSSVSSESEDTASLYNKDTQSESAALQQQVQQGPSEVAKVSDHDTGNIPAEDLISKTSRARLKLRHILRKAASEAKAVGKQTYRELNPNQKKWILDRVLSEFPQLRGYEREIDKILVTMLIQAKFYQKKKLRKSPGTRPPSKKPTELRKEGSKVKAIKFKAKKGKVEVKTSKEVLGGSYKPGDHLKVCHEGEPLATCVFVKTKDDMYAEVKFKDRLKNLDEVEEICLPEAVHGEPKKLLLQQLQENDVFTWKVKKLAKGGEQPKPSSSGSRVLRNKVKPPNKLM